MAGFILSSCVFKLVWWDVSCICRDATDFLISTPASVEAVRPGQLEQNVHATRLSLRHGEK